MIRAASPGEGPRLSEIALAAKASWGYPAAWLESWRSVLRIDDAYLLGHHVLVAEEAGQAIGFAALEDREDHWGLEHLWVDPAWHRRGVGRRLCEEALAVARAVRPGRVVIHSEPNATGFYLRMGARPTGSVPAPIEAEPDRTVPVFEIKCYGPAMVEPLEDGFKLDRRWFALRDGVARSKEPDLTLLAEILARHRTQYAIIGGIALQIHQQEPRTTLDVDVALLALQELPRAALLEAGFRESGRYGHSQNWVGPEETPVQFTDDPLLHGAIPRAIEVRLGDVHLRILAKSDLLHEKLRAGKDPARRRSKRLQDLADAQSLLEQDPSLSDELTPEERAILEGLPD